MNALNLKLLKELKNPKTQLNIRLVLVKYLVIISDVMWNWWEFKYTTQLNTRDLNGWQVEASTIYHVCLAVWSTWTSNWVIIESTFFNNYFKYGHLELYLLRPLLRKWSITNLCWTYLTIHYYHNFQQFIRTPLNVQFLVVRYMDTHCIQ